METTPKQQTIALVNQAQRILIVPGKPDGDSIGSALALMQMLSKLGKEVGVVTLDEIPPYLQFLPGVEQIQKSVNSLKDFIITLGSDGVEPDKLSYNIVDGKLNIVISTKNGSYSAEDVSFTTGSLRYDLIVTLDAADFSQLGDIYQYHPQIFSGIPVVNIDHHASNTNYGKANLVDTSATSTGEILVGVGEALGVEFNADIATGLLTGIISDTGSFQHANTTPKSLTVAAQMVGYGARQQEIIKHLFKTKPLASLKLWGRILSNIQFDNQLKLVWATVDYSTLQSMGVTGQDIGGLIDELMTSVPGSDIVVLLSEREPNVVSGSIRTSKQVDASILAGILGGGGHPGAAGFKLVNTTIPAVTDQLIAAVSRYHSTPQTQENVVSVN
ncbi:MAG: DHH family phosphoesterase [Patescibacteria group bacterium]